MNKKTIILIGRSGSGKGTQGELIQKYLKENDSKLGAETENAHG